MQQIINLYLLFLGLITILNRGGAGIGIGFINISLLSLFIAFLIYFINTKGNNIQQDSTILLFIFITSAITFNHINMSGLNSSSVRSVGVLIYPFSLLAGIGLSKKQNFPKTINSLKLILIISTFYGLLSGWVKAYLLNKVIINNVSLFGIYGSYYNILVTSFCFFFSGLGGKKNTNSYGLLAAASILISGARGGILGLMLSFFISISNRSKKLISKKGIYTFFISVSLVLLVIIFVFPFMKTGIARNTLDLNYFVNAFLSIFSDSDSQFGEAFIGSRTHRLFMLERTLDLIFGNLNYFLLGIPFILNFTDAKFNDPHNGLLSLLARGGIFTLMTFLLLQVQIISNSLKVKKILGPNPFSTFSISFIFSSLIMILFTTMLTSPMNAIPYYFILGMIWEINSSYIRKF